MLQLFLITVTLFYGVFYAALLFYNPLNFARARVITLFSKINALYPSLSFHKLPTEIGIYYKKTSLSLSPIIQKNLNSEDSALLSSARA